MIRYKNPVVKGFYPDPSICRVGEEFYLVNSTFEFFPAVPVFHSRDLVHWKQIGHCISRNSQLTLSPSGRQNATGIYAPSIRYKNGKFYMITTNVTSAECDQGNFYVWTEDPAGEWSDPAFLGTPGIDPSLFFDEDGQDYYIGTADSKICICPVDLEKGKLTGEFTPVWTGTGGSYPEGPHIYKKNGWYYLLISEGGTERCHMITMARSRKIMGPYEQCPYNPVLTNRSLGRTIESAGHADLVMDQHGAWWAVCLGTRTFSYPPKHNLGRETMLVPVEWNGDWPVFGNNGTLDEEVEVEKFPGNGEGFRTENPYICKFDSPELDFSWNYLYNPDPVLYATGTGALMLFGNECALSDMARYAWVGRRQCAHDMCTSVKLRFNTVQEKEEAGLTIFMNHRHHYEAAVIQKGGERKLIFRRQIGSLNNTEAEIVLTGDTVTFELKSDRDSYSFFYKIPGEKKRFLGKGETVYLTTEVGGSFTGNYIALYAMGNGKKCRATAEFTDFQYME